MPTSRIGGTVASFTSRTTRIIVTDSEGRTFALEPSARDLEFEGFSSEISRSHVEMFGIPPAELEGGSPNEAASRWALEYQPVFSCGLNFPAHRWRRLIRYLNGGKFDGRPTARQRRRARRDRRGW